MVPVAQMGGEEFRLPGEWDAPVSAYQYTIPEDGLYAVKVLHSSDSNFGGLYSAKLNGIEFFEAGVRDSRLAPLTIGSSGWGGNGAAVILFILVTKAGSGYNLQELLTGVSFGNSDMITVSTSYNRGTASATVEKARG